jgi:hypothetical protein
MASGENCAVSAVRRPRASCRITVPSVDAWPPPARALRNCRSRRKTHPTEAEQNIVPGLRAGHYLCFFGMRVTPVVMKCSATT